MNHYIIISLKHSTKTETVFWRADNSGYTTNPWGAGIYNEEAIKAEPAYYNDGYNSVAICINNSSLPYSGINIVVDEEQLKKYRKQNLGEI